MFIESVVLDNFRCFGPGRTVIGLDEGLTAFIGANGSGKTAACEALLRLFGVTERERAVQRDDFHVPADESAPPESRELRIEAVLAFPELEADRPGGAGVSAETIAEVARRTVPALFLRMAASESGALKVRIVLRAQWTDDGTIDGAISDARHVVNTFDEDYEEESTVVLSPAERSRVQMIYIPASRDGARQVTAFLRSRLWRAAQWSAELRDLTHEQAIVLADRFAREPVVDAVEKALASRWDELHHGGTNTDPRFRLLDSDFTQLVRNSELVFDPDYSGRSRPAHLLSDGQRSLLHLALTAATLDVEAAVNGGHHDAEFTLDPARLPSLTVVAVEEPENSLSPFYLSRIVNQLLGLAEKAATQSLLSSHSASVLPRVAPERIRYFRLDAQAVTSTVQEVLLPPNDTEAGTYVREAVRAHPELYFAKFVILGEGDTEELVIPRIAQARGVQLDPSFVAVVPLGGRHTNHMWTLLEDLGIPHATLLDLDYGKPGAGPARLRDACGRLENIGLKPLEELEGFEQVSDLRDGLALGELGRVLAHLRKFGIFFAEPLDLDYTMLGTYAEAYTRLEPGERGPQASDPTGTVLGAAPTDAAFWSDESKVQRLRWYRYLFLNRSKPSTHLRALGRLDDDNLRAEAPEVLVALIEHVRARIGL